MDRRGGRRAGAGRPTAAQAAAKAKALAETMKCGPKTMPREYLQALLDSPASSKSEKLRAAELLLKLLPESRNSVSGQDNHGNERLPDIIYSIPRGVQFAADRRTLIWPETGAVAEPIVQEPFKATPQLTLSDQSEYKRERFEVAETEPPANLVRLDSFKTRRDSDDGEPPGAA